MSQDQFLSESLEEAIDRNLISEILQVLKSGKEATVCLCRAHRSAGGGLVAAKVYRSLEHRNFRNEGVYRQGRVLKGRYARALANRSDFGRQVQMGTWVHYEWETLNLLHDVGADVPRPIANVGNALLMEYLGDANAPAPQLKSAPLSPSDARAIFHRLIWNVQLLLTHNRVHGDLSPFNVLYHRGRAVIIDFPQSIDPRENPSAFSLLCRDIENLHRYCSRFADLSPPPWKIATDLWNRFLNAQL